MIMKGPRISTEKLNRLFVDNLGNDVEVIGSILDKPLLVNVKMPYDVRLRVYLYNCTNPPGGRASDEYKGQIIVPGQQRNTKGNFDYSDNRIVLLGACAQMTPGEDNPIFVFWDPMCHVDFAYSANIQVKSEVLIRAFADTVSFGTKKNGEIIIACQPKNLLEGIRARISSVSCI